MRTIRISIPNKPKIVLETDATTFGEIMHHIPNVHNYKVMENVNSTTLESSEAKLPEGDFTIYVTAKKIDGNVNIDTVDTAEREELLEFCKEQDISMEVFKELREDSTDNIREFVKNILIEMSQEDNEDYDEDDNEDYDENNKEEIKPLFKSFGPTIDYLLTKFGELSLEDKKTFIAEAVSGIAYYNETKEDIEEGQRLKNTIR